MHTYCIYSTHIPYRSVSIVLEWAYTIQEEVVNHLPLRKYTVLNGYFVLDLHDISQERNLGVKQDLTVFRTNDVVTPTSSNFNSAFGMA
jgi:hypothetical protein